MANLVAMVAMLPYYGTTQMQLHTHAHVLAYPHTCANMCPVTSDGTLASLTYCTGITRRAAHTCMLLKWIHTKVCTRMLLACCLRVVDRDLEG